MTITFLTILAVITAILSVVVGPIVLATTIAASVMRFAAAGINLGTAVKKRRKVK